MTTTTYAVGDQVGVRAYCRACDQESWQPGRIAAVDVPDPDGLARGHLVDVQGGHIYGPTAARVFAVEASLFHRDLLQPPFCAWCGETRHDDPGEAEACRGSYWREPSPEAA